MSILDDIYIDNKSIKDENAKWKNIGSLAGCYINDAIKEIQCHTEASDSMALHAILPIMSVVVGTKVKTLSPAMDELRLTIWSLIIGDSGSSGKSTTIEKVEDLVLGKLDLELENNYLDELNIYNSLDKKEKDILPEPKFINLHSSESGTYAGLLKDLSKNPHGQVAIYDEASEFFVKMSKDQEAKSSLTSIFQKKRARKSLVGNENLGVRMDLREPLLNLLLISNPDWFNESIKKSDLTSGFLNRFSICHIIGEKLPVPFKSKKKPEFGKFQDVATRIYNYLDKLDETLIVGFEDDCYKAFNSWYYEILDWIKNVEYYKEMKAFAMRQTTSAIKYAVLIKIFDSFYKDKNTIDNKLTVDDLIIGMNIAEASLYSINDFLEARVQKKDEVSSSRAYNLAQKILTYLKKYEHDKNNMLPTSDVIRYTSGLNKGNFKEVITIAYEELMIDYVTKETSKDKFTTYYYYEPEEEEEVSSL